MRTRLITAAVVATTLALSAAAHAQVLKKQRERPLNAPVTMTGCVRDEKGAILTNAKLVTKGTPEMNIPTTFRVTGKREAELKKHIGHEVDVVARFSDATARDLAHPQGVAGPTPGASGASTTKQSGGSTTGGVTTASPADSKDSTPPRGSGGAHVSANTDLPRIEATSVRMLAATCSAQ